MPVHEVRAGLVTGISTPPAHHFATVGASVHAQQTNERVPSACPKPVRVAVAAEAVGRAQREFTPAARHVRSCRCGCAWISDQAWIPKRPPPARGYEASAAVCNTPLAGIEAAAPNSSGGTGRSTERCADQRLIAARCGFIQPQHRVRVQVLLEFCHVPERGEPFGRRLRRLHPQRRRCPWPKSSSMSRGRAAPPGPGRGRCGPITSSALSHQQPSTTGPRPARAPARPATAAPRLVQAAVGVRAATSSSAAVAGRGPRSPRNAPPRPQQAAACHPEPAACQGRGAASAGASAMAPATAAVAAAAAASSTIRRSVTRPPPRRIPAVLGRPAKACPAPRRQLPTRHRPWRKPRPRVARRQQVHPAPPRLVAGPLVIRRSARRPVAGGHLQPLRPCALDRVRVAASSASTAAAAEAAFTENRVPELSTSGGRQQRLERCGRRR